MKNAIMHSEKHYINIKMSSYNKGSYLLLKICKKQKNLKQINQLVRCTCITSYVPSDKINTIKRFRQ